MQGLFTHDRIRSVLQEAVSERRLSKRAASVYLLHNFGAVKTETFPEPLSAYKIAKRLGISATLTRRDLQAACDVLAEWQEKEAESAAIVADGVPNEDSANRYGVTVSRSHETLWRGNNVEREAIGRASR